MRILFVTNFYPPARPGGYTQWCYEVAEELKARGHTISILTSDYEAEKITQQEPGIYRRLLLEGDLEYYEPLRFFLKHRSDKRSNFGAIRSVINQFSPDLVFIWGMWSLSKEIPALVEQLMPGKVLYYLSDYWPSAEDRHTRYWNTPANHWYMRIPKQMMQRVALSRYYKPGNPKLKFEHALCVSQAVKDILINEKLPLQNAHVIHGGTDISRFKKFQPRDFSARPLKVLYAGQLEHHKGVHTIIESFQILVNQHHSQDICLTIVGSGHPQYEAYLRKLVTRDGLDQHIHFHGQSPKEQMPRIMQSSQVLIFPSIYQEPFARMTQEAMLSGLLVIGTTTGGTKEILHDGITGLTFRAEDSADLARKIMKAIEDPQLCSRLAKSGRETVLGNFTLDKMVDQIESYIRLWNSERS